MESTMTKAEIAKAKKAERNRLAYEANKQKIAIEYQANKDKIAEQNAQKKEEISLKNAKAYKEQKKAIEAMSWKETDEYYKKRAEKAHEYYEKNKDIIKEKQEQREIAKALERRGNQLHYRKDQIRKHKEDPELYPHNPETYIAPIKKTRVHQPKNNEENIIICKVQEIIKEIPKPIPDIKPTTKIIRKSKLTTLPISKISETPIAIDPPKSLRMFKYLDEEGDEVWFEEMSESEFFEAALNEVQQLKKNQYKVHLSKFREYEMQCSLL